MLVLVLVMNDDDYRWRETKCRSDIGAPPRYDQCDDKYEEDDDDDEEGVENA